MTPSERNRMTMNLFNDLGAVELQLLNYNWSPWAQAQRCCTVCGAGRNRALVGIGRIHCQRPAPPHDQTRRARPTLEPCGSGRGA